MSQAPAEGARAGESVRGGVKEAIGATEGIRKGINNFFDEALQPSAKRDTEAGVTANHKPGTTSSSLSGTAPSTTSTQSGGTGSGFSQDAKALGQGLQNAISGDKRV